MQALAFYAELLGFLFLVMGVPAALYCLLSTLVQRDFKKFLRVLLAVGIWLFVVVLHVQIVAGGEVRSSQYSGIAGLMQILFFVANFGLLVFSVKTLRGQTKTSR